MEYNVLLDVATELAYRQAMAGAETYRVEECVNHIMNTYGISAEVFAIPNCITVNIETPEGESLTRMRRVGFHGNDLDAVEQYSNLSRRICAQRPEPRTAMQWLEETDASRRQYRLPVKLLGHALGAAGFALFYGGGFADCLCAALCGMIIGLVGRFLENLKVNAFFTTIAAAFLMAFTAYSLSALKIAKSADAIVIGALMILVPGLLFTNAMRDIIFGDTVSGVNRTVQVLLTAAAIALGTASAFSLCQSLFHLTPSFLPPAHSVSVQCIAAFIGSVGFSIIFNIHGPGGLLCALGGMLAWAVYCLAIYFSKSSVLATFIATVAVAAYSEIMARVRKYPAISYLVVSTFPLLPGAGVYYTAHCLVQNNMTQFAIQGRNTIALAGVLAVGILTVSTIVRLWTVWKHTRNEQKPEA